MEDHDQPTVGMNWWSHCVIPTPLISWGGEIEITSPQVIDFKQQNAKDEFRLLMIGSRHSKEIVVPTLREMIGLAVMERDGTLSEVRRDRDARSKP